MIANSISLFQDHGRQVIALAIPNSRQGKVNLYGRSNESTFRAPRLYSMKSQTPSQRIVRCLSGRAIPRRDQIMFPQSSKHIRIKCSSMYQVGEVAPGHYSVLSSSEMAELYAAKCKDLKLEPYDNQEKRFYDFCFQFCVGGKILLREV